MINAAIVGCSGYTAIEAIKILLRHPEAQISAATSRQADGTTIDAMHPQLTDRLNLVVEDLSPEEIASRCDVAFCCLPHGASAPIVSKLLASNCRVIDLSADYRLSTPQLYQKWYGEEHTDPGRLGTTPYGLPELFADQIRGSNLIANPGCYPTSAILPLTPLIQHGLIEASGIVVDSKSGASGAGRIPKTGNLFCEINEGFAAYAVGTHRHQPEIIDIVGRFAGTEPQLVFTPHLVPMDRGILSTIYARPRSGATANQMRECLSQFYEPHPFVRVVSHLPVTKHVANTNYCDITARVVRSKVLVFGALDNLIKGASGVAVQNFNLMFGFAEGTALEA